MTFSTLVMITILHLIVVLFQPGLLGVVQAQTIAYRVAIQSLAPSSTTASTTPVYGIASIFTDTKQLLVGYAGIVSNLEPDLIPSLCTALNGCGVHIHAGKSCTNTTTQSGHYYNNNTVPIDPWIDERYRTDKYGKTNFRSILQMGTIDIEGRAFIVHSMNGTRVGCGLIERVPSGTNQLLTATTTSIAPSRVTSTVTMINIEPDTSCYFGMAKNLEPNLVSFLNKNTTLMGKNCNATNGCGVHLHNGTSCFNTTTQGGHYYNKVQRPIDPWLFTMYDSTDQNGNAYFTGCAETGFGVNNFLNRPFVIHSNNGTRVSCGLLLQSITPPIPAPSPVRAPVRITTRGPISVPVRAPVRGSCSTFGSLFCPLGCRASLPVVKKNP